MAAYWGIHNAVHENEERKTLQGMDWVYNAIPLVEDMRPGDVVYLFHDREYLYGWGP